MTTNVTLDSQFIGYRNAQIKTCYYYTASQYPIVILSLGHIRASWEARKGRVSKSVKEGGHDSVKGPDTSYFSQPHVQQGICPVHSLQRIQKNNICLQMFSYIS
jgi:hypothetical protein